MNAAFTSRPLDVGSPTSVRGGRETPLKHAHSARLERRPCVGLHVPSPKPCPVENAPAGFYRQDAIAKGWAEIEQLREGIAQRHGSV